MPILDPALRAFADALADRYDGLEPLGGGGMADLLVGRERKLDRRVVIKRVAGSLDTPEARSRFEREIALLATLQHPNIVPLLNADTVGSTPYFVMPLVRGESLRERLTRGPLSVRETVAILEDVAQALENAHAAGIVHRDIKPGNILLTGSAAVVADFGIAKAVSTPSANAPIPLRTPTDLTLEGFSLGTPKYMSPEQFAGDASADHRLDLYALGVVGYEMLAGVPPFTGATPSALARAHLAEPPAPLRQRRADVPPALEALLLKCLAKDPDHRPASASALLRALRSPSLLVDPSQRAERSSRHEDPSRGRLAAVLGEVAQAWRSLRRAPGLLVACVFCLAIGLGSTATIFSVADRIMLKPLDFAEPERLVSVFRSLPLSSTLPWSAPNFNDIAEEPSAAGIAGFGSTSRLVALGDRFEPSFVVRTTGQFFNVLRTQALHGRLLLPSDDDPSAPAVVVASYEYWRSHLGGSPTVIGTTLRLDGQPHEVVGVLPPHFRISSGGTVYAGELWVPMRFTESELNQRTSNWLRVFARLAPDVTPERLEAALTQRFAPVLEAHPDLAGHGIAVVPMTADIGSQVRRPLGFLIIATIAVLAIAVINVSSLLLARGIRRQSELAVRSALGATRWEVMRPVFAEGAVIAALGWIAGLVLAAAAIKGIVTLGSARIVQLNYVSIDLRTELVTLATALLATIAGTAAPAWRAARALPADALRGGRAAGSRHQHRTLATLVVVEGALAITLLIAAGLVMKGFVRLTKNDPGFETSGVLTMRVRVSPNDFPPDRAASSFLPTALQAVEAVPGVVAAGAISQLMYNEWGWNMWIRYEGRPEVPPVERPLLETRNATPGFFAATGQRLIAGRLLDDREMVLGDSTQRVVVNEALVKRDFPNEDPIGKRIYNGNSWIEIVGVVADIRNFGPIAEPRPEAYWTFTQRFPGATGYSLVIRTQSADPMVVAGEVERALRAVYPGVAISRVQSMQALMASSIGWPRFVFALFATLASVALLLALAGLFGILSYTVEQQGREYALRSALGASPASVRALIFGRAGRILGVSLAVGLVVAWLVTRGMAAMLYGVEPLDVPVWAAAVLAMGAAGLAAAVGPALRASRVAPMTAMRAD
jgi:putative ABC transport system permease protein